MDGVIISIFPIFLITLIGKIIKLKWLTSNEFWRGLEKLSYFLLFPVLLFNYTAEVDLNAGELIKLILALIASTLIVGAGLIVYKKHYNIDNSLFTSLFQGSTRYNNYLFFGLGDALYGEEGMVIVAIITAYMIIFTNITSVLIFSIYPPEDDAIEQKANTGQSASQIAKNLITNPLIIGSILGLTVNFFDLSLGLAIKNFLQTVSDSALAIGLLCVGAGLKFSVNKDKFLAVGVSCFAKLIALPLVTFVLFMLFGITGLAKSVGILYSCLPTATSSYILSKQLGGDYDSMSSIITFTVIFSLATLALLTYILV